MMACRTLCRWVAAPTALLLTLGCGDTGGPSENETLGESRELAAAGPQAWYETQRLVIEDENSLGYAIAMSGTTAIIGGSHSPVAGAPQNGIHAYTLTGREWGDPQELEIPAGSGNNFSAAISGDLAIVGTPFTIEGGAAYVFSRIGSAWTPTARLLGDPTKDYEGFGAAVGIDGDLAVVGEPFTESVYVFARVGHQWIQQKQLRPSDALLRASRFGSAVGISGNMVVVGAPEAGSYPDLNFQAGKAYVYTKPSDLSGAWHEDIFVAETRQNSGRFGQAVAISGDTVFVGAPTYGEAYAFTKQRSTWSAQKLTIDEPFVNHKFGGSVAISGNRAAVGAPYLQRVPRQYPGGVWAFVRVETGWIREQEIINDVSDELFGVTVGISGDSIIVGASAANPREDTVDDAFPPPKGAAYVERLLGAPGHVCDENTDCGFGHCVSGVCCNEACDKQCEECSTGTCSAREAESRGSPACGIYFCDGSDRDCPEQCLTSDDCIQTYYCNDGTCEARVGEGEACEGPEECLSRNCVGRQCSGASPNGSPCAVATDCERGNCVDGLCCDDACLGQCEACDVSGHEGRCTAVTGVPHGERTPCVGTDTTCRGRCDGEVTDACFYEPATTECDRTCEVDAETVSLCDGEGECVEEDEPRSCGALVCDEEAIACLPVCESDQDCADGLSCWADGTCTPSPRCTADNSQSETAPDGLSDACWPYVCGTNGNCITSCASPSDCAAPNVCDPTQACVPPPTTDDTGGCGCRTAARTGGTAWPIGVSLVLLALGLRRARRRTRAPERAA